MQPGQPQQPKEAPKQPAKAEVKPTPSPSPSASPKTAPASSAQPPGPAPKYSRRTTLLVGATAAVLVVGSLTLWAMTRDGQPRLNDDTVSIVKFITTRDYKRLPFSQQTEYMMVLEDRDDNDELKDLFNSGRISEGEYRAAMEEAWLGQQYKRSQKFATLAPGVPRAMYLRGLVEKKLQKDARKAAKSGKSKKDEPSDSVKRDESTEEARIAEWPVDARNKWEQYRVAYRAEKEAREKAAAARDAGAE